MSIGKKRPLPNGAWSPGKDIAGVHITIDGEELTWKKAARQLRIMADALDAHSLHLEGFNWDYSGDYEMTVMMPDSFPHGDYQDAEGNLVHIADGDRVVHVTWANKDAEQEEVTADDGTPGMFVYNWIQAHGGPLRPAGSGDADGNHEHLRAVD